MKTEKELIEEKINCCYKLKPNDKLTLTGRQLKEFAEYNRKESLAEKGLIRIEDVEKIILDFDIQEYINVGWYKGNWKLGMLKQLKKLGEK